MALKTCIHISEVQQVKLWRQANEWQRYANCGGSVDHTLPETRGDEDAHLPVADPSTVRRICSACRVRPECIRFAATPSPYPPSEPPTEVWVAGRYIPVNKRQARKVREELAATLEQEYAARGDDV